MRSGWDVKVREAAALEAGELLDLAAREDHIGMPAVSEALRRLRDVGVRSGRPLWAMSRLWRRGTGTPA